MKKELEYQVSAMKVQIKVIKELQEEANANRNEFGYAFQTGSLDTLERTLKELERILEA